MDELTRRQHSRREAIRRAAAVCLGMALPGARAPGRKHADGPARQEPMRTRPVPSTGERLPVVGLGTNRFGSGSPDGDAALCAVLAALSAQGGRVIDTARVYGRAEEVVGGCLEQHHSRYLIVTKIGWQAADTGRAAVRAEVERAFERLRAETIDVMMVHDFHGPAVLLPPIRELKQEGRFRYIGMSTSSDADYDRLLSAIGTQSLDFVEVDYSLGNRNAAERVLPAAVDAGVGVIINVPLGGRSDLLGTLLQRPLPAWVAEIECTSWPQVLLKYVLSHSAVTCAVPGTTRVDHLVDNCGAGRGPLPDEALRRRMEAYVDAL